LNDLDDKLTEIAGGDRNNDDYCDTDRNGDLDYTGGDANDVLFNVGRQIDSVASPPDLKEMSAAALNMGKSAASFFTGMGEKVGDAASAIRIRQSMGRPPFVMAAVEDDDDEYVEGSEYSEGEEEDEEVFGWSESEEADEEESGSGDDEVDFTIEGQSTSLLLESLDVVKMRQRLLHAEEERNHCLQMVEDRNQEICKLKFAADQLTRHDSSTYSGVGLHYHNELRREVLWFRTLVAVTRQEEVSSKLKPIISEMRDEVNKSNCTDMKPASIQQNIADLERERQSVKDNLVNSYAKISQELVLREEVKQTSLKERTAAMIEKLRALQNEIGANRNQITQLKLQQRASEEKSAKRTVDQSSFQQVIAAARSQDSPTSSDSSGVLIGKDGVVENA
jgi:hypothetical protein